MKRKNLMRVSVGAVFCFSAACVMAQSSEPSTAQTQPSPSTGSTSSVQGTPGTTGVTKRTENGVTYVCGGVGVNEAAEMKRMARDYDIALTFATQRGNYLADVNVSIADATGKPVLKTTCGAPMLLVDLAKSGTYKISAETGGKTLTRTATVKTNGRTRTIALLWPPQVAGSDITSPATETGR